MVLKFVLACISVVVWQTKKIFGTYDNFLSNKFLVKGQGQRLKVKVRISKIKFYVYIKYPLSKWDDVWYDGVKKLTHYNFSWMSTQKVKVTVKSQNICIKITIGLYLKDG